MSWYWDARETCSIIKSLFAEKSTVPNGNRMHFPRHVGACSIRKIKLLTMLVWNRRLFTARMPHAPPDHTFLRQARRPKTGLKLVYVSIFRTTRSRFGRQFERLQRVFTLRIPGTPLNNSSAPGTWPKQWVHYCTVDTWNLSGTWIGYQKGYSVFLPSEYQAHRPKIPFCSGASLK